MNRRRYLAVGSGVVLAGCVSYTDDDGDDDPSSEDLLQDAIETRRGMSDLAGRRAVTVVTPDGEVERTERIARRPPSEQRIEVVESTDPAVPSGSVTVTNRAETWEYNPTTETVDKRYHPTKVDDDRTLRVLEALLEDHRVAYERTATVDGRETHVLETRPPVDDVGPTVDLVVGDTTYVIPLAAVGDLEELEVSRTVWIDDEYRYPVKEQYTVSEDGDVRHETAVTYTDLAIDEGLEAGTFTYEPPDDATVVTDGPEPDGIFESPTNAAEITPYDLPDPDVPEAYTLDRVIVVEKDPSFGTTTKLWYDDPDVVARELYVAVREERRFSPDALEEIELDGRTAYSRDGGIQSIFWDCGELNYEVSSLVDDDPLREIAASVGCP
ncbi:DUF2092 domain-containing protein [Natronolimnohabitans sp. A-GB9]|uniref:LolA family protein n=1 Tax=Natronolimnohabitans sp. A-GB9 TaxID=3069757 RepID=UPI0027B20DF7|nr:DUF2092 domain-containing protein [Natronolimnohabitans sp. A-GB9]MDQ2049192.1 DUF2092 domain-containing protein [Natronolimnohabitans sp. A-GB9]